MTANFAVRKLSELKVSRARVTIERRASSFGASVQASRFASRTRSAIIRGVGLAAPIGLPQNAAWNAGISDTARLASRRVALPGAFAHHARSGTPLGNERYHCARDWARRRRGIRGDRQSGDQAEDPYRKTDSVHAYFFENVSPSDL